MSDEIIAKARRMGLLPLEMDEAAQACLMDLGIDPATAEKRYAPGTSQEDIVLYERIEKNIQELHTMDTTGKNHSNEYDALEKTVSTDLAKLSLLTKTGTLALPLVRYVGPGLGSEPEQGCPGH